MIVQPDTLSTKNSSDHTLWEQVRNGDKTAYGMLYNKYISDLYRYGMTVYPDKEMVGDAIQEVFIDLWNYRCNLSKIKKLKFYLLSSLRSKIFKLISGNNKKAETETEFINRDLQFLASVEENLIISDSKKQSREKLVLLINDLPVSQREAIMLIFFEGRSYEEASTIMSKSIQSIYTLISRGISTLRTSLNG